jgi:anti-anti-sigma factor
MNMPELHVQLHRANKWLVVQPSGDLVMATGATLFGKVQTATLELELNDVLFDMSRLKIIDSAGLGTLIAIRRQCLNSGGQLRLAECTRLLSTLFQATHLDADFPCYTTVEDALLGVAPAPAPVSPVLQDQL